MADDSSKTNDPQAMPLDASEANDLDSLLGGEGAGAPAQAPAAPAQAGAPPAAATPPVQMPEPAAASGGGPPSFHPSDVNVYPTRPATAVDKGGPGWGLAIGLLVAGLVVGGGLGYILAPSGATIAAPPPTASAEAPPPTSASAAPPKMSAMDKVASGDEAAMKSIADKATADRTVEETLALGGGRRAAKIAEIEKLGRTLAKNPELAKDAQMLKRLRKDAKDAEISLQVLKILAAIPGSEGIDVLYDIWVRTRGTTPTTELAEELVMSKEVRPKASPALAVALDLRTTKECADVEKVVVRAKEHGDTRSLILLGRLMRRFGCGDKKNEDCYPCLRKGTGKAALKDAMKESRKRAGPKF